MVEPVIAFTLFDKLLAAIGLIREGQKIRTEKTDQALFALYTALAETRAYITYRAAEKPRDIEREFVIAKLWHTASASSPGKAAGLTRGSGERGDHYPGCAPCAYPGYEI
jgi:hypothetical protein